MWPSLILVAMSGSLVLTKSRALVACGPVWNSRTLPTTFRTVARLWLSIKGTWSSNLPALVQCGLISNQ